MEPSFVRNKCIWCLNSQFYSSIIGENIETYREKRQQNYKSYYFLIHFVKFKTFLFHFSYLLNNEFVKRKEKRVSNTTKVNTEVL